MLFHFDIYVPKEGQEIENVIIPSNPKDVNLSDIFDYHSSEYVEMDSVQNAYDFVSEDIRKRITTEFNRGFVLDCVWVGDR